MNLFLSLLIPLGITTMIEYVIIQLLMRNQFVLWQVILVNLLTNPGINFLYKFLMYETSLEIEVIQWIIVIGEMIVFIVEAILYHYILKIKWKEAMRNSFVANLCSYLISFVV